MSDFTDYFGLVVEYRDDLPEGVRGFLDPDPEPRFIAVNRKIPADEQTFTIAHELAHHIRDHRNLRRRMGLWFLDREFESKAARKFVRRMRYFLNRPARLEFEADLAACVLMIQLGEVKELVESKSRLSWTFWYSLGFLMLRAWCLHPVRSFRLTCVNLFALLAKR